MAKKPRKHSILKLPTDKRGDGPEVCSFCGQPAGPERRLLAGAEAYICSVCIRKYGEQLRRSREPSDRRD